jgi:hypothetical protein
VHQEAVHEPHRAVEIGRQRPDGSNPRPWFLTIVANECRQRRRGRWWSVIKGQPLPEAAGPGPEQGLDAAELQRALARLRAVRNGSLVRPVRAASPGVLTGRGQAERRVTRRSERPFHGQSR